MKVKLFLLFLILALSMPGCSSGSKAVTEDPFEIELVESIPLESNLDNPDLRNTAEVWVEMIKNARHTLDLGHFYVSPEPGYDLDKVIAALKDAGNRGVAIRFIVDAGMYKTYPNTVNEFKTLKNFQVHIINFKKIGGGIHHAKYMIADGRNLFIGSQNFDWRSLEHIHETGLRILSPALAGFYENIFNLDWKLSAEGADQAAILAARDIPANPVRFSITATSPRYGEMTVTPGANQKDLLLNPANFDEDLIVEAINSAEDSIRIQLLSYSFKSRNGDYLTLQNALAAAAARGVKVQMIVSDWETDPSRLEQLKTLNAIDGIDVYLSTIPPYSGGYISYARVEHCKYMVIDTTRFWLGTSNWSGSYFHAGRNLGLSIVNSPMTRRLAAVFRKSLNSGYVNLLDNDKEYPKKFYGEQE